MHQVIILEYYILVMVGSLIVYDLFTLYYFSLQCCITLFTIVIALNDRKRR